MEFTFKQWKIIYKALEYYLDAKLNVHSDFIQTELTDEISNLIEQIDDAPFQIIP